MLDQLPTPLLLLVFSFSHGIEKHTQCRTIASQVGAVGNQALYAFTRDPAFVKQLYFTLFEKVKIPRAAFHTDPLCPLKYNMEYFHGAEMNPHGACEYLTDIDTYRMNTRVLRCANPSHYAELANTGPEDPHRKCDWKLVTKKYYSVALKENKVLPSTLAGTKKKIVVWTDKIAVLRERVDRSNEQMRRFNRTKTNDRFVSTSMCTIRELERLVRHKTRDVLHKHARYQRILAMKTGLE
jgi:hypothetical protein